MAVDPQEQVMQRLQGLKDSRSLVGQMARGNNVYNSTSNAAQSGPGGPDMGRPPLVPPAAMAAIQQKVGQAPNPFPSPVAPITGQSPAQPQFPQVFTPGQNRAVGNMAQAALQAAASRRMQRGR